MFEHCATASECSTASAALRTFALSTYAGHPQGHHHRKKPKHAHYTNLNEAKSLISSISQEMF